MNKARKGQRSGAKERHSEEGFLVDSAIAEIYAANAGFGSALVAEATLRRVLEMNPDHEDRVEALNLLAQICAQTKRHREALEHLAAALAADPGAAVLITVALAETYENMKKWRSAIKVYRRGLTAVEDASLYNGLGYCFAKFGCLREAERNSRRAVALAPHEAVYANDLG